MQTQPSIPFSKFQIEAISDTPSRPAPPDPSKPGGERPLPPEIPLPPETDVPQPIQEPNWTPVVSPPDEDPLGTPAMLA